MNAQVGEFIVHRKGDIAMAGREFRDWNTYYNSIGKKDVEVGTLLGRSTEVARVTRLTKTQAVAVKVGVDGDMTKPRLNYAGKEMVIRVMLDKGYSSGGLEVGTGGSYRSSYWHVTDEDAVQETLAEAAKADVERKRKNEEAKAREQVKTEKALALLDSAAYTELGGPFNLHVVTFDSPREEYGLVEFVYSVEDSTQFDFTVEGGEVPCKEIEVTAWYVEYPGSPYERVTKCGFSSVKAKTVRLALADVIANRFL